MVTEAAFLRQDSPTSALAKEDFSNAQDLLHQIDEVALGRHIVLTIRKTISLAASTGPTNLDAAQEVS